MGMTPRQLLWMVELPLALPSIVAGLRVATVIGVATATIAAAIGAGGLGEYIFRGLSMVDNTTILAGAIPAAALALIADGWLASLERWLRSRRASAGAPAIAAVVALTIVAVVVWSAAAASAASSVVVGSKNFTEQVVLGELMAQAIEAEGVPVVRKLNLGGTFICDRALRSGDMDLYMRRCPTIHDRHSSGRASFTRTAASRRSSRLGSTIRSRFSSDPAMRGGSAFDRSPICARSPAVGPPGSATSFCSAPMAIQG
jgi:hypothetical protein